MKRLLPLCALLALSARADIVPGLEAYGDLTLVDEVDCATDTTHEFHEYAGAGPYSCGSYVTNILGSYCRVLEHAEKDDLFFSYRLGKDKGLVAHDMYLLVVEYPEDVPRTATLINRAMNSRNGWHTGISVGETVVAHIVGQTHPESMNVPLSGTYKRLEQVMFLNEKVCPWDTTDSYIDSESNGFDVIFSIFTRSDSPDSAGVAVRSIKLYRMNDEKGLATPVRYPAGSAPKRHVTWRDEMGKHNAYSCNADRYDNFRMKMRLMKELGLDTWSRDLLEFGKNQYWDVSYAQRGSWYWGTDDYWTDEIQIYKEAGIYLLPFYEYAGGHGPNGKGHDSADRSITLFRGAYGGHYNAFVAYGNGASGLSIDVTCQDAYDEFAAILDSTILRYKDDANFIGAWIRNRGSMPMSFSDRALARFCSDKGYASGSVTRDTIKDGKDERQILRQNIFSDQYKEYRKWWYGKRADWLSAMQRHLADGGLADAKVFFSGVWGEAGIELHDLQYYDTYLGATDKWDPDTQSNVNDWHGGYFVPNIAVDNDEWKPNSGFRYPVASIPVMADSYVTYGLEVNSMTWPPDEYCHAAPRNDPETYTNRTNVAICYPYNTVYTTIPGAAATYRNASEDLFFSRHFCLYEGCGSRQKRTDDGTIVTDSDGKVVYEANNGYFTTEMDRCGRAIMLPELHALAYQDPTLIGFMQGGHLARNCTKEFRDFNEHFLSLPAVKGTVLWGGGWGAKPYTIRKYVTSDATYYAIINTSSQAFNNDWKYLSDESGTVTLYETVTGESTTLGNGYARFTLEPYQLKVYSTVAPDTPRFLVAVPTVGTTTATVPLAVTTLGGNSATLRACVSPNADMSGATALPVSTLTSAGTNTVSFTGLSPNTTYYATFGLTNALSKGAARVLSFTTDIPSDNPRGTATVSAGVNDATFSVDLSSFGDGSTSCDLYAVFTPADSRLATRSGKVGTRESTGACSFTFSPLSSEAAYTAELFATNNLGHGTRLGAETVTTLAKPAAAFGAGAWAPGLVQAQVSTGTKTSMNKTFDIVAAADATRVPGAAMAGVTANANTYSTQFYQNPYDGQKFYYSQYDTTFGYAGEMLFEAGKTYTIGKSFDDGVLVRIDGADILDHQQYNSTTTKTYTPPATGWKPIEIRLWDGDGGKGPKNGWSAFVGIAYNTTGFTTISAETTGNWTPFMANAGAPLRCRSGIPGLATVGTIARDGAALVVPVSVDSYDEDNVLAVYATTTAPADGEFSEPSALARDFSGWASAAGATPGIGLGQAQNVAVSGLSLEPGATVYAVARLTNARTGYDVVSAAATYVVPARVAPAATLAVGTVGFTDAAFAVNVTSFGTDAASATVLLEVLSGSTVVWNQTKTANATGAVAFSAAGLAAGTSYTVRATVTSTAGSATAGPTAFSTTAYGAPTFGDCAATNVGTGSATLSVAISDLGAGSSSATVSWSLSPSTATPSSGNFAFDGTGAKTVSVTGLAAGTTYTATLVATGSNGTTASKTFTFRTADLVPPAATLAVGTVGYMDAAFAVNVTSLGTDASSATVLLEVLSGSTVVWNQTETANATGSVAFSATGLAAGTSYTVRAAVTSTAGSVSLGPTAFATLRFPLALGEPAGVCNGAGTEATAKVAVTRADVAATLVLSVDGVVAKTWPSVSAGEEYSFSFPIEVGQTKSVEFVLSASGCQPVSKTGSVTGRMVVDWFNVPLADDAYAGWTVPHGADPYEASANWTTSGTKNASAVGTDAAGERVLALATGSDGAVFYAPAFPSESGRTLEVSGTAILLAHDAAPPVPDDAPIAGLAVGTADGGAPVLYGYGAAGWTALSGGAVTTNAPVAWKATLDFGAGTVAYSLGGVAFSPNPALPAGTDRAVRVAFRGNGAVGAFRGVYADSAGGSVELYEAAIRVDGTGLAFTTVGTSEMFAIGLKEARAGAYYVAFAADSLDTPADDWICVACSDDPATGGENIDLLCATVDTATGDPIPTRFFRIFGASGKIPLGTVFGKLPLLNPGH